MASKNSIQRITLEKACSIDGVTDLAKQIREALSKSNKIEFDLSEVTDLELPVIQVLYAASLSATSTGGEVSLVGTINDSVAARLLICGFSKTSAKNGQSLQQSLSGFGGAGVSA